MVALPRTVSPVVEDGGLALGYAAGRVVQADAHRVAVQPGRAGVHLAVGAELDEAVAGLGRAEAQPVQTGRVAVISVTSRPSAGPTVTVLVTGSMSRT